MPTERSPRRYAVVHDGAVVNVVMWTGQNDWEPEVGDVVPCPDEVGIGWTVEEGAFIPPSPAADPVEDEL